MKIINKKKRNNTYELGKDLQKIHNEIKRRLSSTNKYKQKNILKKLEFNILFKVQVKLLVKPVQILLKKIYKRGKYEI